MTRTSKPSVGSPADPAAAAAPPVSESHGDAGPLSSAVLLADVEGHRRGIVVQGTEARILALVEKGSARDATPSDLAVAGVNIRILD